MTYQGARAILRKLHIDGDDFSTAEEERWDAEVENRLPLSYGARVMRHIESQYDVSRQYLEELSPTERRALQPFDTRNLLGE